MEHISLDHISIHPAAIPLFRLVSARNTQGQSSLLTPLLVEKSQSLSPIHVVKAPLKPGHYLCFSGFQHAALLRKLEVKNAWSIIHEMRDETAILEHAWLSEIVNQLGAAHRSEALKGVHDLINLAPKTMRKLLAKNCSSGSAMTLTEVLTGESRSAVRNQFPKPVGRLSELDTILGKEE